MNIFYEIEKLIYYGLKYSLIEEEDKILIRNEILEVLEIDDFRELSEIEIQTLEQELESLEYPSEILDNIVNWCIENNKMENTGVTFQDLLNSKIMGRLIPRSSVIIDKFYELYKSGSSKATEYFYALSKQSNYIRTDRIKKDIRWKYENKYGSLDITINFSKPEKDPAEIAMAKNAPSSSYPKCLLCRENEGYAGRVNHPGRQNHRIVPLELKNERWFFQYSPYIYYNEHCIILSEVHRPMKIDKNCFERLLEFAELFPHYFIGSNADLPIVGGSILSHDHFQGGNYIFPMAVADIKEKIYFKKFLDIEAGIVKWPLSVIRLRGNKAELVKLAGLILEKWINYSDESNDILSHTDSERHNTITPIARYKDNRLELDLVLRNNRTTKEHPLGIFHPHSEYHNIKKENIGLIEVMGLAVLPGRLSQEMDMIKKYIFSENALELIGNNPETAKHKEWCKKFILNKNINPENIDQIVSDAVGETFSLVLEDCGVFKDTPRGNDGFRKFINICSEDS
jgi:UDPglucose--hexose-1-phosphate uridylyltransferase